MVIDKMPLAPPGAPSGDRSIAMIMARTQKKVAGERIRSRSLRRGLVLDQRFCFLGASEFPRIKSSLFPGPVSIIHRKVMPGKLPLGEILGQPDGKAQTAGLSIDDLAMDCGNGKVRPQLKRLGKRVQKIGRA